MKFDERTSQSQRYDAGTAVPALRASLDMHASQPAAFLEMWQHVVDGLTEQIAVLDEDWRILVVNRSWAKVVELYGHFALIPGTDYLQFCREMAAGGLRAAIEIVAGIEEIIEGKRTSFQLVYRSSEPEVGNDHQLCINRFEIAGRKFASITRYDITQLLELRRLQKDFSHAVLEQQAEERRRIARDIHDSTMQLMVSLDLKVGEMKRSCPMGEFETLLGEMRKLISEAQQEIRSISYLAHPPLLAELPFGEALTALVEGFGRRTGLEVAVEAAGEAHLCCPAAEGAVYRIVQEALSNVHRHARASHVTVRLDRRKAMTHIVITDDGTGMPEVVRSGVGLGGMRSRLLEIGGRLFIRPSSPGTAVIASIPTIDPLNRNPDEITLDSHLG